MGSFSKPSSWTRLLLYAIIVFSSQALIYHIRWFVPFLADGHSYLVPPGKTAIIWFVAKIFSNAIFLTVSLLLLRFYRKFSKTGFLEKDSLRMFDIVISACLLLAVLGITQTICDNIHELHMQEWTSLWGIANLLFRSFTLLLVLREPQTLYFLVAALLWLVRQFVPKALTLKKENELFI